MALLLRCLSSLSVLQVSSISHHHPQQAQIASLCRSLGYAGSSSKANVLPLISGLLAYRDLHQLGCGWKLTSLNLDGLIPKDQRRCDVRLVKIFSSEESRLPERSTFLRAHNLVSARIHSSP